MRWLNDHTPPDFRFFAIELRVVRIGESPAAPIFDVVVRPNDFEREIKVLKAEAVAKSDSRNRDFWTQYLEQHPEDAAIGFKVYNTTNQWLPVAGNVLVGTWLATTCGVYVRGPASVPIETVAEELAPYRERLESLVGVPLRSGKESEKKWLLVQQGIPIGDPARWPEAIDWMHERTVATVTALREVVTPAAAPSILPEGAR